VSIVEKVNEVLVEEQDRDRDPSFQRLRDFYETMKRKGLVIKQEYNLPAVDSIGRTLFLMSQQETDDK
jgi:hypothetical protein